MPRPRSLSPDALAAAALRIVDRDGVSALSMRSLGAELGLAAMSLYRYVETRDALEGLVVAAVLGPVSLALPDAMPWRERIETVLGRVRDAIRDHPAVTPLLLTRRHDTEFSVRCGEVLMRALADGGIHGQARVIAFRALLSYLMGAVQVAQFGPLGGQGTAALAKLPRDRFPFLADTARHALPVSEDREFSGGLGILLDGIEARIGPGAPRVRRAPGRTRSRSK